MRNSKKLHNLSTFFVQSIDIGPVLNAADGTPRMINKLCNAGMLVAASRNLDCINADAVMQAVSDCELG